MVTSNVGLDKAVVVCDTNIVAVFHDTLWPLDVGLSGGSDHCIIVAEVIASLEISSSSSGAVRHAWRPAADTTGIYPIISPLASATTY